MDQPHSGASKRPTTSWNARRRCRGRSRKEGITAGQDGNHRPAVSISRTDTFGLTPVDPRKATTALAARRRPVHAPKQSPVSSPGLACTRGQLNIRFAKASTGRPGSRRHCPIWTQSGQYGRD